MTEPVVLGPSGEVLSGVYPERPAMSEARFRYLQSATMQSGSLEAELMEEVARLRAPKKPVAAAPGSLDPGTLDWAAELLRKRREVCSACWSPAYLVALDEAEVSLRATALRVRRGEAPDLTTPLAAQAPPSPAATGSDLLTALRAAGWTVAVHNDYRQDGELHTFWLFTKGNHCLKGEGRTDEEALEQVTRALATAPDGKPVCEYGDGCVHADDLFKVVELIAGKSITLPTTEPGAQALAAVRGLLGGERLSQEPLARQRAEIAIKYIRRRGTNFNSTDAQFVIEACEAAARDAGEAARTRLAELEKFAADVHRLVGRGTHGDAKTDFECAISGSCELTADAAELGREHSAAEARIEELEAERQADRTLAAELKADRDEAKRHHATVSGMLSSLVHRHLAESTEREEQACAELYRTGATRGGIVARAKRAGDAYQELIAEYTDMETERDEARAELAAWRAAHEVSAAEGEVTTS